MRFVVAVFAIAIVVVLPIAVAITVEILFDAPPFQLIERTPATRDSAPSIAAAGCTTLRAPPASC